MGRMGSRGGFGRTKRPSYLTRAQRRTLIQHHTPEEVCRQDVNDFYRRADGHLRRADEEMHGGRRRQGVYWYGEAVKAQARLVDRARDCGLGRRAARMMLILEGRRKAALLRWFA
jgi:hypothetical protein